VLSRVLLEYGDTLHKTIINNTLGNILDEDGTVWALAKGVDWEQSALMFPADRGRAIIADVIPRFHFDDFGHAFLTCFATMTMENWNDNFYEVSFDMTWFYICCRGVVSIV
jgi:hypothetical protein